MSVMTKAIRGRSLLTRWVLVLMLAFVTPAVQDVLTDVTMWVTGQSCCPDDCDETGSRCPQQCAHCPCGSLRAITLHGATPQAPLIARSEPVFTDSLLAPTCTTLDPPFRPPVS